MSRGAHRTRAVTGGDVQNLVSRAAALMTAADLLLHDLDPASQSAAAAVAVIAGIAAADAICGATLGRRSRDQDHRAAADLLREAAPRDPRLPEALNVLLDLKDQAHYGVSMVRHDDAVRAVRRASILLRAARQAVVEA